MRHKNADIRLVEGDIAQISEAIRKYLENANFEAEDYGNSNGICLIKGENHVKSPIKLYFSNFPQIIYWNLEEKSKGLIEVSVRFGIFSTEVLPIVKTKNALV